MDLTPKQLEGFWRRVRRTDSCWIWEGEMTADGYGRFTATRAHVRRRVRAHRQMYELLVGSIPDGLTLDHLCKTTTCVNPSHLEPVTAEENARRVFAGRDFTHCPHGHPYDAENTTIDAKGTKSCRTCRRQSQRLYKQRLRGRRAS